MWLWWVLAVAIFVLSLVWAGLTLLANGQSDDPYQQLSYWPALIGIGVAIAIMVWRALS